MLNNVKSKELANILGITQRRVNQLAKEGIFEKDAKGFFKLEDAVPAYIVYATADNDELRRERILYQRAKRRKAELDLKVREGRLHDAEDVEMAITGMLVTFRNRILGTPQKVAPKIIGLTNLAEIMEVINTELLEALNELSEYDPAMFGHTETEDEDC